MLLNNDLKKEVPVCFFFYTCPKIQKVFKSYESTHLPLLTRAY